MWGVETLLEIEAIKSAIILDGICSSDLYPPKRGQPNRK